MNLDPHPAPGLDPARRASLAEQLVAVLEQSVPGACAMLRGSLARGTADAYSDIDLHWVVPDAEFLDALEDLPEILAEVARVRSIRHDPLLQNSEERRLVFVQFEGVPLYWRVDLEVFAESIAAATGLDPDHELDNRDVRGDDWSLPHSALMNGVAALKYLQRGDDERARESLASAFARLSVPAPDGDVWDQLAVLAEEVGRCDLALADLVRGFQLLQRDALTRRAR